MAEEMDQEQFPVHPYTCQTERVENNSLTLSALAFGSGRKWWGKVLQLAVDIREAF